MRSGDQDNSIHTKRSRRIYTHRNKSRSVIGAARFILLPSDFTGPYAALKARIHNEVIDSHPMIKQFLISRGTA